MSSSEQNYSSTSQQSSSEFTTFSFEFPSNDVQLSILKQSLLSQQQPFQIVEILNCPAALDASRLISNPILQSLLESQANIIILKLKINEELKKRDVEKPKFYKFKMERNLLISYESIYKDHESQKILYWKNSNRFFTVKLIERYSFELTEFVRDFLIEAVNVDIKDSSIEDLELIKLVDSNKFNLLMKAVDNQLITLVDELLRTLTFDIYQKSYDGRLAADIAWEKGNFEILLALLEANSTYPKFFHQENLSPEIEKFIEICSSMHEAITDEDVKKIQKILNEKPKLKYFYSLCNVSAATTAFREGKYEIYNMLLKDKRIIGPEENFSEIRTETEERMSSEITSAHDDASKELPQKHLFKLYANSLLSHDDQFAHQRFEHIKNAYELLNEIPLIRGILRLITIHNNFKIRFDFNRTSVEFMDPFSGSQFTNALYAFNENKIYIGAKELLSTDNDKFDVYGTLAYELCYFAMNLTFCNYCKPYAINDEVNEIKFMEVIKRCETEKNEEEIVRFDFDYYGKELWPAQLIVKVPHMIARYQNDTKRLNELKDIFKDLFDYYDEVVVTKMNETLPMLEKLYNNSFSIKYVDLTDAYKAKIHHSEIKFQGVQVKFNEIIEEKNLQLYRNLTSDQIRKILNEKESVNIEHVDEISEEFYVEREFIKYDDRKNFPLQPQNFEKISSVTVDKKMFLLTDHAGAGKTMTFRSLKLKLKKKFPQFVVYYIDLKMHLLVYEKFERKINENHVLKVFQEILSIKDELQVEIFTKLYHSHRVILLYDGVDEIAPKFKEFFTKLIEIVKNSTKIQQWISTRPQHIEELKKKFGDNVYKLMPYNYDKKVELTECILKKLNIKNVKAESIPGGYSSSILSYRDVDNPFIIKMMIQLYLKDETIVHDGNFYSLYVRMIDMKKRVLNDKGEIVNEDCDNRNSYLSIWQIHQIYALKLIFKNGFKDHLADRIVKFNDFKLLKKWNNEKSNWTPDAISRYGFLIVDHWNTADESPDFVHRAFAEFFVAQFVIQDLYKLVNNGEEKENNEVKLRVKLLINIVKDNKNKNIWHFISSYDTHDSKKMKEFFNKIFDIDVMKKIIKENPDDKIKFAKLMNIDEDVECSESKRRRIEKQ